MFIRVLFSQGPARNIW